MADWTLGRGVGPCDRYARDGEGENGVPPPWMTDDPVFSFNQSLPAISNIHEATFNYLCDSQQDGPGNTPGILAIPDGRRFYVREQTGWLSCDRIGVPYNRRACSTMFSA